RHEQPSVADYVTAQRAQHGAGAAGERSRWLPSLDAIELGVHSVALDQVVVRPFLGYEAVLEHDNLVRVTDRAQTVGNRDDRSPFHQAFERLHHELLGLSI